MSIADSAVERLLRERFGKLISASGGKKNVCPIKLMSLADELGISGEKVKAEFEKH